MKRIIIIGLALLALCAWRYSSLSRHYVSTQGVIVRLHPYEHQSFDYLYVASGASCFGTATAAGLGRDFAGIKIRDPLTVFYDTKHPADSTVEPPVLPGIMAVWFFVFLGAIFSIGVISWFQSRNPGRK
ncbi:MAG: hypothetical protein P4N60_17130 [Verrucomicrobiae bacterium]|nr:hypothetical protein [Verrucomicrobiae bacterium]